MSRDTLLDRGRLAAQGGMSDTCTIRRRTGSAVNPTTAVETPTYITVYSGMCRIKMAPAFARPFEVAESHILAIRLEVQLPITVTGLKVRDEFSVITSRHDSDLVGRLFLLRDLMHMTDATARRVQVIERTD